MLLASGVNFGLKATIPHGLGVGLGFMFMLLCIGLGLAEVFQHYPFLYDLMKWGGILYTLYLAYKITQSGNINPKGIKRARPMTFIEAVAFQWINPKAWIMAIGFFSSYLPRGSSNFTIIWTTIVFGAINIPCIAIWAIAGVKLGRYLAQEHYRRIFNWTMAILLVGSIIPILKN